MMDTSYLDLNSFIKNEADEILFAKGLMNLLSEFGQPQISGSYTLNLMTWRDLDIYLVADEISNLDFFKLGGKLNDFFNPVKMSFRNELIANSRGLPHGLYWGIYLGNERRGAWKIDIWAVSTTEFNRLIKYCADIKQQLTTSNISIILAIKSQCWQDPEYRRSYTSMDIYKAVLEHNVSDVQSFKTYMEHRNQ
jgi:hypothetical protein